MAVAAKKMESLIREIRATFQWLTRYANALHEKEGVNASMRAVMEHLYEKGPQTVPEIASVKNVSRQHIQKIVNELFETEFVEARVNPKHQRSVLIALTRRGRNIFASMAKKEEEAFAIIAGAMPAKEMSAASAALQHLREVLAAQTEKEK